MYLNTLIEELEIVEEAEEIEAIAEPEADEEESSSIVLSSALNPFKTSIFPVLIIDKKLKIVYTNPSCDSLLTGFHQLPGNHFFNIFNRAFELDDIRKIREAVVSGNNGFSWKGTAHIKKPNAASVESRVYIFPLEMDIKAPSDFVVMFDDVTDENKQLLRSVFLSLLEASKLKDNDTGKHIIRVNQYSKRLAEELANIGGEAYKRIDADFVDNISFLAAMHDVGKIGTPDDILNKEGPLSNWEWAVMREHTKNGAFILSTYPNPMAKEIALSHHEKWNGAGYPFQLEGEMIPLAARIVTIADVYDALRMERSYKPALSHEVTKEKVLEGSGSHFDPTLVHVFKTITEEFKYIYDNYSD